MRYNVILNTVPETGSWGSYWVYTGLRGAALGELPASGTVLRIILYLTFWPLKKKEKKKKEENEL